MLVNEAIRLAHRQEQDHESFECHRIAAAPAHATVMSRRTLDAKGWEERRRRTPLGVIGEVEDVAQAAVFLASPAAKFISGAILPVDGGFAMAAMIPGVDIDRVQRSSND